ncbi:MAG: hypothetical protein ITG02_01110 [Patulibacter sp.]|nr:hypothetical protein [Patulibacter sp.]
MSTVARPLSCCDCGREWTCRIVGRRTVDVRCPMCSAIHQRRVELRAQVDQLAITDRGTRNARAALAAARHAGTLSPGSAGPSPLADAMHALARSGHAEEHVRERLLVRIAAAAVLWAAEISGALDG